MINWVYLCTCSHLYDLNFIFDFYLKKDYQVDFFNPEIFPERSNRKKTKRENL